jgi:hypothetical protein
VTLIFCLGRTTISLLQGKSGVSFHAEYRIESRWRRGVKFRRSVLVGGETGLSVDDWHSSKVYSSQDEIDIQVLHVLRYGLCLEESEIPGI